MLAACCKLLLQAALRFGRPDLPAIFREMGRLACAKRPKDPRVAVLVCGPAGMVGAACVACWHVPCSQ
jgi:hypothetical protein